MLLRKTEKARNALSDTRPGDLSLRHRRILIPTDGKRSINDPMSMLGSDILGDSDALMRAGYLATPEAPEAPAPRAPAVGGLGQRLREATSLLRPPGAEAARMTSAPAVQPAKTGHSAVLAVSAPSNAHSSVRRSLAASKRYVMDLLQMQRDLRIAECRTEIQCAQDEATTVVAVLDGVRHLIPLVSVGIAERILARLDEVLPEPYLPALRALQSELSGKPVLAVTNAA